MTEPKQQAAPEFRTAKYSDVQNLVDMLADDKLGTMREDNSTPLNPRYLDMFSNIDSDLNNELVVAEVSGKLAGMMQLTFIPYLTHTGSWRCLIEGVRIHRDSRGQGLGSQMIRHAIDMAEARGCSIVQLTSDKLRPDAISFYHSMGFVDSHEGFKLKLEQAP